MAKIVLNQENCKSCYLCIDTCPKHLLKIGSKIGKTGNPVVEFVDPNCECLGCKSCAMTCPDLAITEVYK